LEGEPCLQQSFNIRIRRRHRVSPSFLSAFVLPVRQSV
jgi:hypothetical protein